MFKFKKKGLTLIELLAVIAIIAILFILLIPRINSAIDKARIVGVQTDFRSYQIATQTYYMESSEPKTAESLNAYLDKSLQFTNNLSKELNPWGLPYEYVQNGDDFVIKTKQKSEGEFSQYELHTTNQNGNFEVIFKGFDEELKVAFDDENITTGEAPGNTDSEVPPSEPNIPSNPDDLDNDGWHDTTFLPLGLVSNVPESAFGFRDNGDGTGAILSYSGTVQDIIIPAFIQGKRVVEIGELTFQPHDTNGIGRNYGWKLKSVVVPSTVVKIGNAAFSYNEITAVTLPNSIVTFGDSVFAYNKLTEVIIPTSITTISNALFYGNKLSQISIPSTITSIGKNAFSVNELKSVTIPSSVKRIEENAFRTNLLTEIHLSEGVEFIATYSFSYNDIKSLTIPSTVTMIENAAFYYNNYLSTVVNKSRFIVSNTLKNGLYFTSSFTITEE